MPSPPKGLGLLRTKGPQYQSPHNSRSGVYPPLVMCKYFYWAQHSLRTGSNLWPPLSNALGGAGEAEGFAQGGVGNPVYMIQSVATSQPE